MRSARGAGRIPTSSPVKCDIYLQSCFVVSSLHLSVGAKLYYKLQTQQYNSSVGAAPARIGTHTHEIFLPRETHVLQRLGSHKSSFPLLLVGFETVKTVKATSSPNTPLEYTHPTTWVGKPSPTYISQQKRKASPSWEAMQPPSAPLGIDTGHTRPDLSGVTKRRMGQQTGAESHGLGWYLAS